MLREHGITLFYGSEEEACDSDGPYVLSRESNIGGRLYVVSTSPETVGYSTDLELALRFETQWAAVCWWEDLPADIQVYLSRNFQICQDPDLDHKSFDVPCTKSCCTGRTQTWPEQIYQRLEALEA